MAFWSGWRSRAKASPRAAVQGSGGGVLITTPDQLDEFLREGNATKSGARVTVDTAMQVAAVYACVRIISGSVATLPLDIKRRVDDRTREDASDTPLSNLIRRKPNRWQKPSQFRRMQQAHVLLRGNGYSHIVRSRGEIVELIPLSPDPGRMQVQQNPDLSLRYEYRRKDGGLSIFKQDEILHLFGLTLDGITGVTPLTYARESIGEALAMADSGASVFKHGLRAAGAVEHPNKLSPEAHERLKASLDEFRAGGDQEGQLLILEEGMKASQQFSMSAVDAQWIEGRKFSRTDIAMFFGVPPFMIGDTEKNTSWGSGIEQQKDGYVTFTLDDHLTMWEEAITDLAGDPKLYARFNRNALVKGNIKDRWDSYVKALQWGVMNPNEVRALEDENPRAGGDDYYDPPNTAGGQDQSGRDNPAEDPGNDPAQAA